MFRWRLSILVLLALQLTMMISAYLPRAAMRRLDISSSSNAFQTLAYHSTICLWVTPTCQQLFYHRTGVQRKDFLTSEEHTHPRSTIQ